MKPLKMSILPFIMKDPWEELERPLRLFDQDFGLGMRFEDLYQPIPHLLRLGYNLPCLHGNRKKGISGFIPNKDDFEVMLDVQQFRPEEISVKTVDNSIVVEGKHEEKRDEHGFVSRHFIRRYVLPQGISPGTVTTSLSSDGVLTITAPKALPMPAINERIVPITQTGVPAIKEIKQNTNYAGAVSSKE
ncbi:hypothetical protein J437_LFUL008346 [Ladona fulva]|uniref:SHSP domain-containing protein n=1 Tax=Ladona fulva TaxID=123851 RepID=A0A8K0K5P5_LADFU|nr:hypothetical protein J437_LFUL008346 [Ladona fulva]